MDKRPAHITPTFVTEIAVIMVAGIGWLDYATGEFSMVLLYLLPVAFATWYAGRASGWFIALLSAAGWASRT